MHNIFTVGRLRGPLYVLLVFLYISSAVFGDDHYWATKKQIDCTQKSVPENNVCDGTAQCADESDEEQCDRCRGRDAFHCDNKRCVPAYLRCDGYDDCWDGSDERKRDCNNWISPYAKAFDIPAKIEYFDAEHFKTINYTSEIAAKNDIKLKIIAYKSGRFDKPLDAHSVNFQHMNKVVFYIPGFMTEDLNDGITMKNALVTSTDDIDCIILFDWRKGSYYDHGWQRGGFPWQKPEEYSNVVYYNLPQASNILADFVLKKIPEHVKVHLIGFSLGGQIAGIASRIMKNHKLRTIDRISAIDPAGPLFEYTLNLFTVDTTHTLRKTDAVFVDVVHACLLLGMQKEAGHLDVFIKDVDCKHPYCLHQRSFDAFIASLTTCSQITCPHDSINRDLDCDVPDRTHLSSVGYLADLYSGRGKHVIYLYRKENGQKVSTGNCTDYLKVNLPAKNRICLDTNDCGKQPYLSECHMLCTGETKSKSICGINEKNRVKSSSNQNKNTEISPRVSWSEVTDRQKCGKALSCTVEKSVPVQYYVAYKKPNTLEYFYISRSEDGSLVTEQPGLYKFSYPESVLGQTLAPIYEHGNSITYAIWNDDVPYNYKLNDTRSSSYGIPVDVTSFGHSKGVLAYSKNGGFLMSHSVPQYPPNPNDKPYQYPLSEKKYAQMAVCVTSNRYSSNVVDEIEALLDLMINFKPYVYASRLQLNDWPIRIRNKFETLVHPKDDKLKGSPAVIDNTHYGRNFIKIHSFGRSSDAYFQDSIEKLAEHYSTSMFIKSWSGNTLPSTCNRPLTIENIKVIRLLNSDNTERWNKTADHTNWIVSKAFEKNLMCVGDLYRDKSIISRGGMFVCIQDIDLYITYLKAVHFDFQACTH